VLCSIIYDNLEYNCNSMASLCVVYATLALLCIEFDIDTVFLGHVQLAFAVQVNWL